MHDKVVQLGQQLDRQEQREQNVAKKLNFNTLQVREELRHVDALLENEKMCYKQLEQIYEAKIGELERKFELDVENKVAERLSRLSRKETCESSGQIDILELVGVLIQCDKLKTKFSEDFKDDQKPSYKSVLSKSKISQQPSQSKRKRDLKSDFKDSTSKVKHDVQ